MGEHYAEPDTWTRWAPGNRDDLPQPLPQITERRAGSDGTEYGMAGRLDPLDQTVTTEIRVERWRDGRMEVAEQHVMHMTMYLRHELALMLELAGFAEIEVHGDHQRRAPASDDPFVVFAARA